MREAQATPNVQLLLTTMLFALSDLLESGRMEEHLAMLDTFRTTATDLHLPMFDVYAQFIEASHELSAGRYAEARRLADSALAAGIRSHGRNAEVTHAGILTGCRSTPGGWSTCSRRSSGRSPPTRAFGCGRSPSSARSPRPAGGRGGALLADLVDVDGPHLRDNQMFFPSVVRPRRRRLHAR